MLTQLRSTNILSVVLKGKLNWGQITTGGRIYACEQGYLAHVNHITENVSNMV